MARPSRRDDVLRAASTRFYRDGISATGIDTVIGDAGVAKMTLYGNFGSKERLVVAYLEARHERFVKELEEEIARRRTPRTRALAPVTTYRRYLDEEGFHGCAFVNAAAELPVDHPGRDVVVAHKRHVLGRWTELLADLGADDPPTLALECFCLLEGAFAQAGIGLGRDVFDEAAKLIRARLEAATA